MGFQLGRGVRIQMALNCLNTAMEKFYTFQDVTRREASYTPIYYKSEK